jgi:hypothetical protein
MKLTCAAAAALMLCLGVAPAFAQQTPAQRAEQLNNEGKDFFRDKNYPAAADKFRQAAVLSPEGRFYFNLCYTLDKMGQLRDALMACQAVEPNGASIPLQEKTDELMDAIRGKLGDQGGEPPPGGGDGGGGDPDQPPPGGGDVGDPDGPPPGGGGFQGGGGPPPPGGGGPVIEEPASAPDNYAWSIGGELGGLTSSSYGRGDNYEKSGLHLKLFLNLLVAPSQRIGLQGYLNITQIGDGSLGDSLEIIDLGGALFKHFPLGSGDFVFTPYGGVHLGLIRPAGYVGEETAVALGIRVDAQLAWLLGRYKEHQLSASFGINGYSAAGSGNINTMDWGLDKASVTTTLTLGYTYRFSTPFGQSPVFTLE